MGVHDRGEEDGQLWISMDFVDGLDAARLLADRYPAGMPIEEVARIVTAVASALDYAHKQGLLHRDVKPANIMMTGIGDEGEQRILLTDFGIARNVNEISGLTKTNMAIGTVAYCAPEQLLGEDVDGRVDQYSLAATAFHLLTGSQLFPNSNPAVVISRQLNVAPPVLADSRPELAALDPVLAIALAKKPDDRFKRCSDFASALSEQSQLGWCANNFGSHCINAQGYASSRCCGCDHRGDGRYPWRPLLPFSWLLQSVRSCFYCGHHSMTERRTAPPVQRHRLCHHSRSRACEISSPAITPTFQHIPRTPGQNSMPTARTKPDNVEFLDFWATIQSVTVVSVSPRDATSVVAQLKYVRRNGTSDTENRWLKMALVNGAMLIDESERARVS